MIKKSHVIILGVITAAVSAVVLQSSNPAQAQQPSSTQRYEAVYAAKYGQSGEDDARIMTRVLNERAAAGWKFVGTSGATLIFSK